MIIVIYFCLTILLGYPLAECVAHGLDPLLWPSEVVTPRAWFDAWGGFHLGIVVDTYWRMLLSRSPAFSEGFWTLVLLFSPLGLMISWRFAAATEQIRRDPSNMFGGSRFATSAERAGMSNGLELGIDPETGRSVRVAVQGTLATIAPPRKGKTSGQLIPNLAYPEVGSWSGPAVVIDPKGEIFKATAERRRAMGRRVICLDPVSLVGGSDRWNPLHDRDPSDVLYLQHTALALLPEATGDGEASA